MSDKSNNYEVAFHILPNVEEAKIEQIKQGLENLITSKEGVISYSKLPERTRLSYPIQHLQSSFFGYIDFSLPAPEEALKEINEYLKLNNDILRFLVLKLPSNLQKGKDVIRQLKMRERAERKPRAEPKAPVSEEEKKEMEEKLEELIEKL